MAAKSIVSGSDRVSGGGLRGLLLFLLIVLAMLAIIHPETFLQGKIYASSDAANANAFTLTGNRAMHDEGYPFWNPYLFGGMPTFGSLAYVRFLYPPGELFNILQNPLHFPAMTWVFGHLIFGALGMFWLLGRLNLPVPARVFGALVWLLFPNVLAWTVHGHGSKLCAFMYLPWIVSATLGLFSGRALWHAGWLALLLGMQILLGHVQITYYTLMITGFLVSVQVCYSWRERAAAGSQPIYPFALFALAVVLALMIGAVLLWPVRDYAAWSIRGAAESGGASYAYATNWSLSPRELGTLVLPSSAGFGKATYQGLMPFTDYPLYFGFLTLGLTVFAFRGRDRRLAVTFSVVALAALLISFGHHMPIFYNLLYKFLPYFNKFRIPSMILSMASFSVAILAAMAIGHLTDAARKPGLLQLNFSRITAAVGAVLLLASTGFMKSNYYALLDRLAAAAGKPEAPMVLKSAAWSLHQADLLRIGLVLLVTAGALIYASRSEAFRLRGLVWVLCALLFADMAPVARRITHPETSLRQVVRTADGGASLASASSMIHRYDPFEGDNSQMPFYKSLQQRLGHDRLWPLGNEAYLNNGMTAGIRSLGGYHPAKPAAFELVRQRLNQPDETTIRIADWLGGRLIWNGQDIYDNPKALPRARLVDDWRLAAEDLGGFLDQLQSGGIDPARVVTLPRRPDPLPQTGETPLPPVTYDFDGMNRVELQTSADRPAVLVLADNWLPGWSVTVDGASADLLLADHMLRAVALTAGTHRIKFAYEVPNLSNLLFLSGFGILVALLLLLFDRISPRRNSRDRRSAHPEA